MRAQTIRPLVTAACLSLFLASEARTAPIDGTFTYQGRLTNAGVPMNGTVALGFSLYEVASGPNTPIVTKSFGSVPISNGLFTVSLDFFDGAFDGSTRWLGIRVGEEPELTPRQAVVAAPYASYAITAGKANSVDNPVLAWGKVAAAGAVSASAGLLSVTHPGTGRYVVTTDYVATTATGLIVSAVAEVDSLPTSAALARLVTVNQTGTSMFEIYITNGSYVLVDNDFMFTVTGH